MPSSPVIFVNLKRAAEIVCLSRASIYRLVTEGLLPPPVHLSPRRVAWLVHELEAVNAARIRGEDDEAVRGIISKLVEERKAFRRAAYA